MRLYFSGSSGATVAGVPMGEPVFRLPHPELMLSYYLISVGQQVQDKRMKKLIEVRSADLCQRGQRESD